MSDASSGGLAALNLIAWIVTHGVAMGWYIAGPLALQRAKSFPGINCQFLDNAKPGSGCLNLRGEDFEFGRRVKEVGWVARDDACGTLAPGKGRVERIVNAAAHHAAALRFRKRLLIVR